MWGAILSAILSNAKSSEGQSTVPVASNWGNTIKGPQSSDSTPELAPQDFSVKEKEEKKGGGGLMDSLGDMLGNMGGGKGGAKGGASSTTTSSSGGAKGGASSTTTSSGAGASGAVSDKNAKDTTGPVGKESNGKGWNWKDAVKRLIDGQEKRYGGDWGVTPVQAGNYGAPMVSDERLKNKKKINEMDYTEARKAYYDSGIPEWEASRMYRKPSTSSISRTESPTKGKDDALSTILSGGFVPVKQNNEANEHTDYSAASDERLKRLFKDDGAIDAFSKIDAYVYKYNNKAQNLYGGQKGVDKETHFGPIAQDLAKNPVTNGTVHKDENGYLNVDTRQLSLTNTAMISQLARKVQELEEKLGGR